MKKRSEAKINTAFGFTLIEVLVSVAVIGILATLSSVILINTLRSSNKANITNEAKENLALVAEYLQRDVRSAADATYVSPPCGSSCTNQVTIYYTNHSVIWRCISPGVGYNNYVTREDTGSVLGQLPVTNKDTTEGVSWSVCRFSDSGSANNKVISLDLTLIEGAGISSGPQEFGVKVQETITAFTRSY